MSGLGTTILTGILGLGTFLCSLYLLYLLGREKGGLHALLGFLFPPYPYIWGWINARRLQIVDVMVFWTLISLMAIAFPIVMGFRAVTSAGTITTSSTLGGFAQDSVSRGPIRAGAQVSGQVNDLFGVDEWTLNGSAGQRVTIWCMPAAGSDTDPRVTILDPNGVEIASDDDGGGDRSAMISDLVLPANGTYRILVDVWSTGPYVLGVQ